jgi:hypothetical protein
MYQYSVLHYRELEAAAHYQQQALHDFSKKTSGCECQLTSLGALLSKESTCTSVLPV